MDNQYTPHYLMQFFTYEHLQNGVAKETSKSFFKLAQKIDTEQRDTPEKEFALRQLLLAKDAAVRNTFSRHKQTKRAAFLVRLF